MSNELLITIPSNAASSTLTVPPERILLYEGSANISDAGAIKITDFPITSSSGQDLSAALQTSNLAEFFTWDSAVIFSTSETPDFVNKKGELRPAFSSFEIEGKDEIDGLEIMSIPGGSGKLNVRLVYAPITNT